ncbi:MAG: outer membrane lipoprotein-sorting protein [Proteobacteria bacterium]|nr:outer membrane lipoprotein-sorting protein [Pseudomonadota bacterium]
MKSTIRSTTKRLAAIAGLISLLFLPHHLMAQETAKEWLSTIDRDLNPPQYESYRKLINIEPDGSKKEFVLFTVKQGRENVAALFLSPTSEKGRATLRVGENMWLYIPNVGRPLRITSLQSVTGGVFNNSDILRVDYEAEYDAVSIGQTDQKGPYGNDLLQLNLKAKTGAVAYDKLEMMIDPELKSPVLIRAITVSGVLIKTIYFKKITDFGQGIKRPAIVETDSPLYKGYKSIIVFAKIKPRKLSPEVFTTDYMSRIETLR